LNREQLSRIRFRTLSQTLPLSIAQPFQLPGAIMNNSEGRAEPQRQRTLAHRRWIIRVRDPAADHRVDVHMKVRTFSASICNFLSKTFKLFFETSSGITLSIMICM
jgi:hypothetical protein